MKKWEISLLFGAAAALFWCAFDPRLTMDWWGAAFSPLCDTLFRADCAGSRLVLRSGLWELIRSCLGR